MYNIYVPQMKKKAAKLNGDNFLNCVDDYPFDDFKGTDLISFIVYF